MFVTILCSILSLIVGTFIGIRVGLLLKLEKEAIVNQENIFQPDINESEKETTTEVSKDETPKVVKCPKPAKAPYVDEKGIFHLELDDALDPICDEIKTKLVSYINEGLSPIDAYLSVAGEALDNAPFSNETKKFLRENIVISTDSFTKTEDEIYQETAGKAIDYMYDHRMLGKKNDRGDIGPEPVNENSDNTFTPEDVSNIEVCDTLSECTIPDTIARVDIIKTVNKKINVNSDNGFEYEVRVSHGKILKPGQKDTKNTVYETILLPSDMADATEDEKCEYAVKFMDTIMTPVAVKRKPLPEFNEEKFLGTSSNKNTKVSKSDKNKGTKKKVITKPTEKPAPKKRGRKKKEK